MRSVRILISPKLWDLEGSNKELCRNSPRLIEGIQMRGFEEGLCGKTEQKHSQYCWGAKVDGV